MNTTVDLNLKKSFLKKQACFSSLTDKEIEDLAALLIETPIKAGETIVTEGDRVDSVFLIVSGSADVKIMTLKNNAVESKSIATLTAGESIGLSENGFYSLTGKRTATVIALTDMLLLHLDVAKFHGFALANHHVSEVMRTNAELNG
jgi:CRP-like cAMP-binding protein